PATWKTIIDAQCGFALGDISSAGSGVCPVCTKAPVINAITPGSNVPVTGIWTSLDPSKPSTAVISLYRNGTLVGTTTATSGVTWSITVSTVYINDEFYAKAKSSNESECLKSEPVKSGCTSPPAAPVVTCAEQRGIEGTIALGTTISIYEVTGSNANPSTTLLTTGLVYVDATNRTFQYYGSSGPTAGGPCSGGANDMNNGTYMLVTNSGGCVSSPVFICISGNTYSTLATNAITLSTPIYSNQTSVNGSGATVGQVLRLFVNGFYVASQTASATTFTFSNLSLKTGDVLKVYSQATTAGSCMTVSNPYTVTCWPPNAPSITSNQGYILSSATSIGGKASATGSTIKLFLGTPSTGSLVNTTTVSASGTWSISGLTLTAGQTYYATQTVDCESAASQVIVIKDPTTACASIAGTYYESSSTVVGTVSPAFSGKIRLYLDGVVIDSINIASTTNWSIPVNTVYTNKLYVDGVLTVSAEAPGFGETQNCSAGVVIQCIPPTTPSVTPTSRSIYQGQSTTFSVSSSDNNLLYSLVDNSGNTYAISKYGSGSTITVPSQAFNTIGTYNLFLVADKLFGGSCTASQAVTVQVNAVTLPAKFLNIAARKVSNEVQVTWTVANENNISHYLIERSTDCIRYQPIGTVTYNPSTRTIQTYTFSDVNPSSAARVCYRVMQVDVNGNFAYSSTVVVTSVAEGKIQLAPNPAIKQTTVFIPSNHQQIGIIQLMDMNGRKVLEKQVQLHAGDNTVYIYDLDSFGKGNYLLKVNMNTGVQCLKLIIK
ncbi:MAG: T9SS type A sorting domain-containing protein, partial [Chitinophagaceae bacterium]|nr:T9SS type A sorting domain-containing protein [Chitinophagaceae bacterium]